MMIIFVLGLQGFQIAFMLVLGVLGLLLLVMLAFYLQLFNLWMQARLSGVPLTFLDLIGMRFRRVDPKKVVLAAIRMHKAELAVPLLDLQLHYLSAGDLHSTVVAAITEHRATGQNHFNFYCQVDLAGYDAVDAASKVIDGTLDPATFSPDQLQRARVQRRYDH